MKIIWSYISQLRSYRYLVGMSIACHFFTAIFTIISIPMVIPFFQILFNRETTELDISEEGVIGQIKTFFNRIILEHDSSTALLYICFILIAAFFLKNLFRYLAMFFMVPVRNGIVRDLRQRLFSKYLYLPVGFFKSQNKGDLLSRISVDIHDIELSILNVIVALFKSPMIIIGSILFMVYISPTLTLFVLALLVFTTVVIGGLSRPLKRKSRMAQNKLGEIMATAEESLTGIRVIKSFLAEHQISSRFLRLNNEYRQIRNNVLRRRDLSSPLSEFLGILTVVVLLWYGSLQVFAGTLLPETFFAFIFAFYQVIEPSKSLAGAYFNIQKGIASAERIEEVLQIENPLSSKSGSTEAGHFESVLKLQNVSFTHKGEQHATVKNINLTINKGEKVALVGRSGAGKTTLVELLLRFYDCQEGNIHIDGINVKEITLDSLRKQFALVTQDPILFRDTICNNISLSDPSPIKEAIIKAARQAFAHEFIEKKPEAYATIIGNQGELLSGGEKQRLSLARAFYKNAPILLLDEATSSLDPQSELYIQQALDQISADKTVIIIAHSMKFVQLADRIIILQNGEITEEGSHKELIERGGEYKNFVQLHSF